MIEKVRTDIITRLHRIETGEYGLDDVRSLFIDIRDSLPEEAGGFSDSGVAQLYDVFNFAAHPNSRKRGKTFRVSEKIVKQFTESIRVGGSVSVSLLDLRVVDSLLAMLATLGIPANADRLAAQEDMLRRHVYQLLDGVVMEITNDAIESACIHIDQANGWAFISFKVRPFANQIGNLSISGAPTMRFRLL